MRFESPLFFLLFIGLVPLFILRLRSLRGRQETIKLPDLSPLIRDHVVVEVSKRQFLPEVVRFLALSLVIFALARPQMVDEPEKKNSEGLDIVLAIDTSGSMQALDFKIGGEARDRLYVVKEVISDFIAQRNDDRIGLVVFGSEAFTQSPLTLDHELLFNLMEHIEIGMVGRSTAIGNAIATGVKRLKGLDAKSKILILLTDGENTAGSIEPLQAAEAAKNLGVKIYSIGVGGNKPVPFPQATPFGMGYDKRIVKLDEKLLKEIATMTGGRYFLASDTSSLRKVYDTIDKLETTVIAVEDYSNVRELFHWFIAVALIFLISETVFRLVSWGRFV